VVVLVTKVVLEDVVVVAELVEGPVVVVDVVELVELLVDVDEELEDVDEVLDVDVVDEEVEELLEEDDKGGVAGPPTAITTLAWVT
jgi:hypothetical protein